MNKPRLFVGSSSEGLEVARAIQAELRDTAEVTIWDQGVFQLGRGYFESITRALDDFDFGVFVLRPDDVVVSRGKQWSSVRDNILIELGLFAGRLGRTRAFLVCDSRAGLKIPSDLDVAHAEYKHRDNLRAAVGPACTQIRQAMRGADPAPGRDAQMAFAAIAKEYEETLDRLTAADGARLRKNLERGDGRRLRHGLYGGLLFCSRALATGHVEACMYGNMMEWEERRSALRVCQFSGPYNERIITRQFPLEDGSEGVASEAFAAGDLEIRNAMQGTGELMVKGEGRLASMMSVPIESPDDYRPGWVVVLNVDSSEENSFPEKGTEASTAMHGRVERLRELIRRVNRLEFGDLA